MPMDMTRYPVDWKTISLRIRTRDGWRCKWCQADNGKPHPETGSRVVLTVAHLGAPLPDGTPGDKHNKLDVRDENLAALCQRCHLRFDADEHRENAAKTRRRKFILAGNREML
jgi:5-methylcytosine-specific restriction endonuclease McrA